MDSAKLAAFFEQPRTDLSVSNINSASACIRRQTVDYHVSVTLLSQQFSPLNWLDILSLAPLLLVILISVSSSAHL